MTLKTSSKASELALHGPRGLPSSAVLRAFSSVLLAGLCALTFAGCANRQAALWNASISLVKPNEAVDKASLRPDLRYMRVTVNGKAILMVLGRVDKDVHDRPVLAWYSAEGDVLLTQAGRLVGMGGGPVEWLNVQLPADLPAWTAVHAEHRFVRHRDEMPGYRWRREDHLVLRPIEASGGGALIGWQASSLRWFEESVQSGGLPPARYALMPGSTEPAYVEQCLSQAYCLSWQTWPPQTGAALSPTP